VKVYDEHDRLVAHIDKDGIVHGDGVRVSVVVTAHRDDGDEEFDLPECAAAFCPSCFWPTFNKPIPAPAAFAYLESPPHA